jgi:hypothetical protein
VDRELTPQELAYAAGILDGEGCIKLYSNSRGKRGYYLRVEIVNTNRSLIVWLHERFGGSIQVRVPKNPKHKTIYDLNLTSQMAASMLKLLRPYLLVKAPQADIGIIIQGMKSTSGAGFSDKQQEVEEFLASTMVGLK